ncbi:MAG: TlpA disulfide reductase family protein [Hyphomonadaceae bacterium]
MLRRRALLMAALAAAAAPARAASSDVPLPPALDQLLSLPLQRFDGVETTLGDHLRPGPALVSFWASWCAPCVVEARHLSNVRRRYDVQRLNIVGLNVELIANEAGVRRFLERTRPTFTQLRADMSTYRAFGGSATQLTLPRLYAFDATGRPTAAFGAVTVGQINRAAASIVGG